MDKEKSQQKALKQTKQKKSKSAEFLMAEEGRDAAAGTGNPAFNMSSPDLSAYQTSEKEVIRDDMSDRTLATHQGKLKLLAFAEPKGNEYSRNYFDPLMEEEINPRQCGMEVSREVCFMTKAEKAESEVENTADLSEKDAKNISASMDDQDCPSFSHNTAGSIANKMSLCATDYDPSLHKEDYELPSKEHGLTDHPTKKKLMFGKTKEIEDYSQGMSYLEELEKHRYSVCCSSVAEDTGSGKFSGHVYFVLVSVFSELQLARWRSQGCWFIFLLMAAVWFLRLYLHYLGQWLFLEAISTPVTKFDFYSYTVELCYPASSLHISEELPVVVMGPLTLNVVMLLLVLIRWGCQMLFNSCPDVLSKVIMAMGLWTLLDPLAVFIVDAILGRLTHNGDAPVADAVKLYWAFIRTNQPEILGVIITVLVHILLFIISSLSFYVFCIRLHSDSWVLDTFQRIHSEESKFFIPYDLEISNQELSFIVKKSEQWRGINGERRKVAVYDYIWNRHGIESSVSSGDLQHQNETYMSVLGPGDVTSHISVYTIYPSGFQELYRHFLRLPGGAIVEVFGDISGIKYVHSDVATAIQKHINEMDTVLRDSFDGNTRQIKIPLKLKSPFPMEIAALTKEWV
ncbi:PREDICTED: uncharacterized protein LOC102856623 [Elephantulus edwardii]|uniref:uncharacterized protein LOC102856623 n=1 Tax=Elephantulus edwardii TaxID=28737 RepID=UPI0003F06079|nr:PREDICTED: uncharacterized protein LOC102856623 [Elephantulus edwardii]